MTKRVRNYAGGAALVGAIGTVAGLFVDARQAAYSYLVAWIVFLTIGVGALAFLMMANVTRATWFVAIRRVLEALALTLPVLAVLFLPIVFGAKLLYPWARDPSTWDPLLAEKIAAKHGWLKLPFWTGRAVFYLAVWSLLAIALRRWSLKNEVAKQKLVSGALLPLLGLTLTFAAWDWMMSTDPTWASNMYGFYVFAASFMGAIALAALAAHRARELGQIPREVGPSHFQAVGNLMLAAVIFWSYIAFEQMLILWMANLPEEVPFYGTRITGSWKWLCWALGIGHFAVPFMLLLQRPLKRNPASLARIGIGLLVVHVVDVHWLLMPNLHPQGWSPHWLDFTALLAVGGVFVAAATTFFLSAPTVPEQDPALRAGLAFEMQ